MVMQVRIGQLLMVFVLVVASSMALAAD